MSAEIEPRHDSDESDTAALQPDEILVPGTAAFDRHILEQQYSRGEIGRHDFYEALSDISRRELRASFDARREADTKARPYIYTGCVMAVGRTAMFIFGAEQTGFVLHDRTVEAVQTHAPIAAAAFITALVMKKAALRIIRKADEVEAGVESKY